MVSLREANNLNCCNAAKTEVGRGTTQPIYIDLPDELEWTDIATIWVTVSQAGQEITTKTLEDIQTAVVGEATEHFIKLTQEETLMLDQHIDVEIQVRARDNNGDAFKSDAETVPVGRILKDGVI